MIAGHLHRRRGDQPDLLADVQVHLGHGPGPGPDPGRDRLLVDLVADLLHLGHGVTGDEAEGRAASVLDVPRVLPAGQPEVRLQPDALEDHPGGEEAAPVEPLGQMEQRRALDHGVVQVEERGGRGIGADHRLGRLGSG